ncbi:MAG: XRE family transcriptional regulator [Betaproteobacteria bacterium HGW-Betaproteobacteria-16]|nr:MAG: XRE family transcriptional regulator [Betaproteobacteria bacterium HGW-Betaproteobacteria-16]
MPAKPPPTPDKSAAQLKSLGKQLRERRKALQVSSTAAAEAAGMSRVTLHRIEKGEPSVAAGAWANAMEVLGMTLLARNTEDGAVTGGHTRSEDLAEWIPVRVRLADYPQLKALAWQVHGTDTLSPLEALGIYERNARHLDAAAMSPAEQALLQALRTGLGSGPAAMVNPDV